MSTKKTQRVAICIIAIVMTVGTLGAYFIAILQTNNQDKQAQFEEEQLSEEIYSELSVDPTAYTVEGPVQKLEIVDLSLGKGDESVKSGDIVTVHYKGTIAQSGLKFESSYDLGEPITVYLDQLIEGWKEGLIGMKVGGKRRLVIPSEKGYGDKATLTIPANSDLVFEVELMKIEKEEELTQ